MLENLLVSLVVLPVLIGLLGPAALDYRGRRRAGEARRTSARILWILLGALGLPLAAAQVLFPSTTTTVVVLAVLAWGLMGGLVLLLALATITWTLTEHITGIGEGMAGESLVEWVGISLGLGLGAASIIMIGWLATPAAAGATFVIAGLWFQALLRMLDAIGRGERNSRS